MRNRSLRRFSYSDLHKTYIACLVTALPWWECQSFGLHSARHSHVAKVSGAVWAPGAAQGCYCVFQEVGVVQQGWQLGYHPPSSHLLAGIQDRPQDRPQDLPLSISSCLPSWCCCPAEDPIRMADATTESKGSSVVLHLVSVILSYRSCPCSSQFVVQVFIVNPSTPSFPWFSPTRSLVDISD